MHRQTQDPISVQIGIVGGAVTNDVHNLGCGQCPHPLPVREQAVFIYHLNQRSLENQQS